MTIKKEKFKQTPLKKYLSVFLLGIFIGTGITSIIWAGRKLYVRSQSEPNFRHVSHVSDAPYYDKSAFSIPLDIRKSQEASASSTSAVARVRLPIIMYHYIEYVQDAGDIIRKKLDITPANFESQLKSLKDANYTTYFVKDVPQFLADKSIKSSKDVILTFDDGYEDFYTDAFPILKRFQMKATIYIVNNFINKKGYLKDSQIRELINSGLIEVGSHTLDHAYLKQSPPAVVRKQVFESKKRLEDEFGIKVETFAYPYGAFNSEVLQIVKEASFSAAASVIPGVQQGEDNLFYLSRIRPGMLVGVNTAKILESLKK